VNVIEGCAYVFPFFCLCDLAETLFQQMESSFQVDWKSLHQSILLNSMVVVGSHHDKLKECENCMKELEVHILSSNSSDETQR
jgi:hypothetical protein